MKTSMLIFTFLWSLLLLPLSASAFYNPQAGRWLSRDPIDELGFQMQSSSEDWALQGLDGSADTANLYAFVHNAAVNLFDPLGLLSMEDILGLALNPPCGSVSVKGKVVLVDSSITGIGVMNKIKCNGVRALIDGRIKDLLKKLPYLKSFTCKQGNCRNVATLALNWTFTPSVPITFTVDALGDPAPPSTPSCNVVIKLKGTISISGDVGYCCAN